MASYVEAKKSMKFIVGYVCSRCRTMIVKEGTLYAVGQGPYEKHARSCVDKAFSDGIYALQNAHLKPFRFSKVCNFEDEIERNTTNSFYYRGMDHSCPYCGNKELWQAENDKGLTFDGPDWSGKIRVQTIKGVPEESRPFYFETSQSFSDWRSRTTSRLIAEASQYWAQRPEQQNQIRSELSALDLRISELKTAKASIGSECAMLKTQIDSKTEEAKRYSLFSGERRTVNKEISILKKSLAAQESEDSTKSHSLDKSIISLNQERRKILIENFGVIGKMNEFKSPGTVLLEAYHYE